MDKKRIIGYAVLFLATLGIASEGFTNLGFDGLMVPFVVTIVYFTGIFIVAQIVKNNSIVDMNWGLGFVVGSWLTLFSTENPTILSYAIVALITVWGDNVVIIAFFRVFMVQGLINFTVGSASYAVIKYNEFSFGLGHQLLVILALLIAFVGFAFEVIGDRQLKEHIKKGSGTLLQSGLWSITRHPNYFGEILIWFGLYFTGITLFFTNSISPIYYGVLIISPVLMATVLLKVSTPLLEKNMEKYAGWEAYTKRVPMIFPWAK